MTKILSRTPATVWEDAMPLGNGKFGALVWGATVEETVTFNLENIFLQKEPAKPCDIHKTMGKVKEEINAKNYYKAEKMLRNAVKNGKIPPYQPLCEMKFETYILGEKTDFKRELDLKSGECRISFLSDGKRYMRRQFMSKTENQFVMNFNAPKGKKCSSLITLQPSLYQKEKDIIDNCLDYAAVYENGSLTYKASYKYNQKTVGSTLSVRTDGKVSKRTNEDGFDVLFAENYSFIDVYVTGYAFEEPKDAVILPYDELFKRHKAVFSKYYNKVVCDFGYKSKECTEELLLRSGYNEVDSAFLELMFNYSRYLFISSATDCDYPANLQGIWSASYRPIWGSDFHNNVNIQMNYWFAHTIGMDDAVKICMDYYFRFMDDYRDNAKNLYGAKGIMVPMYQTSDGKVYGDGKWIAWPIGGAWLSQLFYDYYLYTGDKKMLKEKILPFMLDVAEFIESYTDIENNKRQFNPSISPENMPITEKTKDSISVKGAFRTVKTEEYDNNPSQVSKNATMDIALSKELLTNIIDACKLLGYDYKKYEKLLSEMPDYKFNDDGAIKEWLEDDLSDNYVHRHLSHLYPVFPGFEAHLNDDRRLIDGAKNVAVKHEEEGIIAQTGWSYANLGCVFTRLRMPENAYRAFCRIVRSVVGKNLFTYHNHPTAMGNTLNLSGGAPFQIDANFGIGNMVCEMFLYSDLKKISIAPSVPNFIKNAKMKGLVARGGIITDIEIKNHKTVHLSLTAKRAVTVELEVNGKTKTVNLKKGKNVIM